MVELVGGGSDPAACAAGLFFISLLKQKLTQRCPKQGGGGQGHFWTMSERKQLFFQDYFPESPKGFVVILHKFSTLQLLKSTM